MRKVGQFLGGFIAHLGNVGAGMGVVSLIIMALMITFNVILRFLFNKSLLFAHEYSAYLLIVIVYMGLAYVTRMEAHINVDAVVKRFPETVRHLLGVITLLAALVLMGLYFWFAWELFVESVRGGTRAATVSMTLLWIPQVFLCVGLIFISLELVAQIVKKFYLLNESEKKASGGVENA